MSVPADQRRDGARPWTEVGTLGGPQRLRVDARGCVALEGGSWELDWWVGADDRWHVPATDAAVRQHLVRSAPVVETSLRVPGGDVHHRVGAVVTGSTTVAVVEVANDSPAPLALALVLRPAPGRSVGEVALTGSTVSVDGAAAVVLPEHPSRAVLLTEGDGDPLELTTSGSVPPAADGRRRAVGGRATVVLIVPVAHRATYRFQVRLDPGPGRRWPGRRPDPVDVATVATPDLDTVVRGWAAQVDATVRLELPPSPLADALPALRAQLLLAAGRPDAGPEVAVAAARAGYGTTDPTPWLDGVDGAHAGTALWAAGVMVDLGATPPPVGLVAAAAESVARTAGAGRPPHAGAGLAAAAALLARAGEAVASGQAARWEAGVGDDVGIDLAGVDALLATASPTWTWPDGAVVAARVWSAVRDALVDDAGSGVDLLPGWRERWRGAPLEVHQLPTAHGLVSLALRWHGPRPALLWSLDGATGPVEVRAPVLDPAWSSPDTTGEELLAAPAGT